ncbi:glycosyl transferase 41 family protein [Synechococcus sp. A15-60]|nr:glycosyl transferase 41 family protein [Synechococcus sp. A15-60]
MCCSRKQAVQALDSENHHFLFEERFLLLLRAAQFSQAEAELLSSSRQPAFVSILLLRIYQGHRSEVEALVEIAPSSGDDAGLLWFAKQALLLWKAEYHKVIDLGLPPNNESLCSPWHRMLLANALVWLGRFSDAEWHRQKLGNEFLPPERVELDARLAFHRGEPAAALMMLSPLLEAGDASSLGWEMAFHALNATDQKWAAQTVLTRARSLFPDSARLIGRAVIHSINERQPINGRRLALLERSKVSSDGWFQLDQLRSHQNLGHAFETGGRADLLCSVHPSTLAESRTWEALGNYALQMASLASPMAQQALLAAQELLPRESDSWDVNRVQRDRDPGRQLRIGLITPDVSYHPVCRFLLMQLNRFSQKSCEYYFVKLAGLDDWATDVAKNLVLRCGVWNDLSGKSYSHQLAAIRELNLDIAVDLAGWTGSAVPGLFASRIAPIQVNYLGFFASTGIPEMDYWLGDSALFPQTLQEWSSESIWRMPRCFLAWQPFEQLPEGRVVVPAAPASPDLVFGSFNHVRKLADATLRLWGRILEAVPGSRLALKAYTSDDPGTATLLRRRMKRCGLDPDRVTWLPTCASPEDHLRQYGLVDVALDPFPNGGCTTSCEALWMGVPVITLAGDRYVSRMTTAVLSGAKLPEWIASSEEDYFNKAVQAASQRQHVRQSREQLRRHLQASPLGDAAGLNAALASVWRAMVQQKFQGDPA